MNVHSIEKYPSETKSGATTNAYVEAVILYNGSGAIFQIKNTHVSATMYYKIDLYLTSDSTCIAYAVKAETGIAANTAILDQNTVMPFYKLVVSVKQNSGAGTYQIDALQY